MEPHVHVKAERELLPEEPLVAFQQLPVALLAGERLFPPVRERVGARGGDPDPLILRRLRYRSPQPHQLGAHLRECAARRPSPRANLFGGGALVASRLPLHALANSTRWAPTPKIRALKLTVGRFVISVMYAAVLYLFTARHPHAPPSQVVAGPPHRRVAKRHTAG